VEDIAKISVLVASLLAMLLGYLWLYKEKTIMRLFFGAKASD
jgi:hypothetical protein